MLISIHAPHEGERRLATWKVQLTLTISIHAPHEGERLLQHYICIKQRHISIHAPHEGERRACGKALAREPRISIHAPHEGERRYASSSAANPQNFNPRSPRGGATLLSIRLGDTQPFQSTLPTRGSDVIPNSSVCPGWGISIHAPHEGERLRLESLSRFAANFNPRSPRGGATRCNRRAWGYKQHFNPRSPRGGATQSRCAAPMTASIFQSTLPTRGSDQGFV